jgi:N-acetylmuramoyl-L-alanine amidase
VIRESIQSVSTLPRSCLVLVAAILCAADAALARQVPPGARPGTSLTILAKEPMPPMPTTVVGTQEFVSLDDVASRFQLTVREDAMAGGITLTGKSGTIVLSLSQGLASAGGRLVSLPSAPIRSGRTWLVPIDLLGRGLPLVQPMGIELRRASHLLLVGDVRVPRVTVRHEAAGAQGRVVVDIIPRADHRVEQDSGRLFVRFDADAIDATIAPVNQPELLTGIRAAETGAALVLELGPRFAAFRASDQPTDTGVRMTIDLMPAGATAPPVTSAAPPPAAPEPPPIVFEQPRSAIRTIVLDPGHGGDETGAKGPAGTLEKDVALGVARQLKGLLEARLGLRVLLTREGDQTVPLDERAAIANNNKADLFVSLHANASVRDSVVGAEVFYLSLDEYGPDARRTAEPLVERVPALGGDREVTLILWEMAQARHLDASARLAAFIEADLRARVAMSARAIQQAPFRVLVGANMPAVLVEMGFITNPDEEKKLASPAYQSVLTQSLFESIVRFRAWLEAGAAAAPPAPRPEVR